MKHLTSLVMMFGLSISPSIADTQSPDCWKAFMEDGGNTLHLCIYHEIVSMTVFYPNGDQLGDENICQQTGSVENASATNVKIDLFEGYCGGNRRIAAATLECAPSDEALDCLYDDSISIHFKK